MTQRFTACAVALLCVCFICSTGVFAADEFNFSIDMPDGWWRVKTDKYLVITKDGAFKHYILAQERPLSKPFKNTGKILNKSHLPNEVAQIVIDEVSADPNLTKLQIIENNPSMVAGKKGFQLTLFYTDPAGIIFKTIYYGCVHGDYYYNLRYSASEEKYFNEDAWKIFSGVRKSFKID